MTRLKAWWGERPWTQVAFWLAVLLLFGYLGDNTLLGMRRLGLVPGFDFLRRPAGFEIGESWIAYSAADSFGRAILVGLLNTVQVGVLGCLAATFLGLALGLARLSGNLLLSRLVQAYVEVVRNTPLLLQLFFWSVTIHALPPPRQALHLSGGVLLSNRGIYFPWTGNADGNLLLIGAIVLGLATVWRFRRLPGFRQRTILWPLAAGLAAIAVYALAVPWPAADLPALRGFNIQGGRSISPEFAALLVGLTVNAAGSIAEIVRAGIQSVPAGQWEAARALGLSQGAQMRLVVLPQALKVIVPLMTSTYVTLLKHSSIAVAIGYPDLVNILNTTANQSGQALEAIVIMMTVYLAISLLTSMAMNVFNRRLALRGAASR